MVAWVKAHDIGWFCPGMNGMRPSEQLTIPFIDGCPRHSGIGKLYLFLQDGLAHKLHPHRKRDIATGKVLPHTLVISNPSRCECRIVSTNHASKNFVVPVFQRDEV